jgi:hypothetical protein
MGFSEDLDKRLAEQKRLAAQPEPDDAALQLAIRRKLRDFVETAQARGIKPTPLITYNGSREYKSSVLGWALPHVPGLAVGTDGELYNRMVRGGWFGNKEPTRIETVREEYTYGWDSEHTTLDEMLIDALVYGSSRDQQ